MPGDWDQGWAVGRIIEKLCFGSIQKRMGGRYNLKFRKKGKKGKKDGGSGKRRGGKGGTGEGKR